MGNSSRIRAKKNIKGDVIALIFLLIFLIIFIISSIKIAIYLINGKRDEKVLKSIAEDVAIEETPLEEGVEVKYKIDFASLKEKNPDTVRILKSKWHRHCNGCS